MTPFGTRFFSGQAMLQIHRSKSLAKVGRSLFISLCLGLISLGSSCSRPLPHQSQVAIVGGQPVAPGEFEALVALVARAEQATDWSLLCSGTLISPQVILTAAHCLDSTGSFSVEGLAASDSKLRLGIAMGIGVEGGHFDHVEPVTRARIYPYFREHPLGIGDVAVLFLAEPLAGVTPIEIPTTLAQAKDLGSKQPVTLVGFGRRDDRGIGLKYKVKTSQRRLTPLEVYAGGEGRDACAGDSGGAGLRQTVHGSWLLAGVVARGASFQCGPGGVLTITSQVACWIKKTVTDTIGHDAFPFAVDGCNGPTPSYTDEQLRQVDFASMCRGDSGSERQQANARNMAQILAEGDCSRAATRLWSEEQLDLSGALLDDISPLAGAPKLRILHVRGNFFSDVQPLLSLPLLAQVDITANFVSDPEVISLLRRQPFRVQGLRRQLGLFGQTAFLQACQSPETSVEARRTIKAVMWKTLAEDCVTANQRLLSSKSLSLKDRGLKDLSPLFGLEHLESLVLSGNPIKDISPLAGSESLRYLDLTGTAVEDLSPLGSLIAGGLSIRRP